MEDGVPCGGCGKELPIGTSICAHCGWDITTAVIARRRGRRLGITIRVIVYLGLVAAIVLAMVRFNTMGPGPDLKTTARWLLVGDDGRAAELVTLHRAHETAKAAARFAIHHLEAPVFEPGWEDLERLLHSSYLRGTHLFRSEGARFDLLDPRILAELRFEWVMGE